MGPFAWSLVGIALVTLAHLFAGRTGGELPMAIASRLYYLPIVYGAIRGGMALGFAAGAVSGLVHGLVMISTHGGHASAVMTEHLIAIPFLALLGLLTGALRDHERHERSKREEVTEVFGRYVSHQVVDEILNREVHVEGALAEATVLFSDLRDFTSLSETLPPRELLAMLNRYFTGMVDIVLDHKGFLDKFIGDSIMAVFGVPLRGDDDAMRAVRAAVAMSHALEELNGVGAFAGRAFSMGIGLHTGQVVAGNVGSPKRMEYTVLGDTVNLAARLEGLNRRYGSGILISDTTYKAVRHDAGILAREVDAVRVKGRRTPCVLYEIYNCCASEARESKSRTLGNFILALQFYKSGEWDEAENGFRSVLASYPDDAVTRMYLQRIADLRRNTPEEWDGVYDFTQK